MSGLSPDGWVTALPQLASLGLPLGLRDLAQARRRLASPLVAGLLVVLMRAGFLQDAALHCLLLEPPKGRVDPLARLYNHLCQMFIVLSYADLAESCRKDRRVQ